MPTREQQIAGGLVGLLVGDALGVPYEFYEPDELPPRDQIEFAPPPGFRPAHWGVPSGTWSDDGAHALCLLESLLECGRLDPEDLGRRLLDWYARGHLAVDAKVFDIGNQTARALARLKDGVAAVTAGPASDRDNGNGSLMRVLPLALGHRGTDAELVADARAQSRVTHGHLRSQLCCALYCLWARRTLDDNADPWADAAATLRRLLDGDHVALAELDEQIRPEDHPAGRGGGYVVDCLWSAHDVIRDGVDFEATVRAAVALGHDTDTTACVAGGIAGLGDGVDAIPDRWRESLRGRHQLEPLLRRLLAHAATS